MVFVDIRVRFLNFVWLHVDRPLPYCRNSIFLHTYKVCGDRSLNISYRVHCQVRYLDACAIGLPLLLRWVYSFCLVCVCYNMLL